MTIKRTHLRTAKVERNTTETQIQARLTLEGKGRYKVSTGIRFLGALSSNLFRCGLMARDAPPQAAPEPPLNTLGASIGGLPTRMFRQSACRFAA